MKKLMRTFALMAVAALGLSACTSEKLVPDNGNADGKFVTVHFGAEAAIEGATKATLTTEDEKTFKSAWENGDALSVKYSNDNTTANATTSGVVSATWTTDHFEAALQKYNGAWDYNVVYPAPDVDSKVDFGSARTQKGNAYNSKYDLMKGSAIEENADAGKTADGQNIVFNMTRQTAIAYFHLTSTIDEDVVSAKLSVEGGNIASSLVMLLDHTDGFDLSTEDLNEITITFEEGTAPETSDFKLWFNVLPTIYDKMTLTVETTGHTMTISRTAEDMYLDGKLYKVVKDIPADKWVSKAAYTGGDLEFDFKTVKPEGWPTTSTTTAAGTYKYTVNGVDYSFIHGEGIYCGGTAPTSAYLMIAKGSSLGLPAIAGYKLVKVVGTLNDSGSPSTASKVSITDGSSEVTGGAEQTWGTKGGNYTYSLTETEENTVYYLSVSNKNCQMIKLVLSYEPATPSATKYAVYFATVEGGSFSASPSKAEAGAEVTLTATPAEGYAFNNDWSVKGADETEIEVVDGKFTMPAQNVTVSGTFSKVSYTITKAAAENGSFIVKNGDAEVTTAFKGDKLTLEATPAEGYICNGWTVVDAESNSVYVSNNSFTMPASAVTISTTFSVKPEDITYDHAGTAEDPYSVADVLKYISTLGTATSTEDVYVKGVITSIEEVSTSFGNATYKIKDEGVENEVKIFRGLYLDGAKFTSADQIGVGDEVVVVGKVLDYNGTPEVNAGNKIVSIIKAPYLKATASKETGIAAAGETVTITVDTNVDSWNATSDNAAFVVGTPSGNTVDVVVSENTDATERTATITVRAGDLSKTITLTQKAAGAAADVIETIDFESVSTDYSFWTFTNMTSQQTVSITANGGTYYGTTGGKETASITTKNEIASPKSITFYVSKQSNNTKSSSWNIQVSSDNSTWTDVKTQSATTMSKGSWVKVTQDLSSYSNVYVRVYYTGSTAVRNIDDLSLTYSN